MGASGVTNLIDQAELLKLQPAFSYLSQAIDFPDEVFLSQSFLSSVQTEFPEIPEKQKFLEILESLRKYNLIDLKAHYSNLFELNKRLTLYMTYYKLSDSREQGGVLAKLKMLYEMFGVSLEKAELTDYLPTMLEFLAVASFTNEKSERLIDLSFCFSILEDGSYELLQKAKELTNEPYIDLISVIRKVLKYCITIENEEAIV